MTETKNRISSLSGKIRSRLLMLPAIKKILATRFAKALVRRRTAYYMASWFSEDGDNTFRLDYPLNQRSVVFDVGGYIGDWAEKIEKKYNPKILIFEPIPEYHALIKDKFQHNPKISVYPWGLADKNCETMMSSSDFSSSVYKVDQKMVKVRLRDIKEFMEEADLKTIDVLKINIEGGEYLLLQRIIATGIVTRFTNIAIQFHDFYPDAFTMMKKLQKSLSHTHRMTWNHPFVWENWTKK